MTLIVAKTSPWIQLDSENKMIRTNSEKVLDNLLVNSSIIVIIIIFSRHLRRNVI